MENVAPLHRLVEEHLEDVDTVADEAGRVLLRLERGLEVSRVDSRDPVEPERLECREEVELQDVAVAALRARRDPSCA